MNAGVATFAVSCNGEDRTGVSTLKSEAKLNRFFAEVEKRALRIAEINIRDRDEALDLVQDAMIRLARNYAGRPDKEWAPLFYRILQDNDYDPVAAAPDPAGRSPDEELQTHEAMQSLEAAISGLPGRQREAFMLRTFEGLDVAGTATAMGCSQGSVKTHYSRAVHSLRETLGEHWQ
jgi:RNA polymerase sigma-70 factor (ECF subfamily)